MKDIKIFLKKEKTEGKKSSRKILKFYGRKRKKVSVLIGT